MESKIAMKGAAFPKLLAQLSHSNQFLKVFSVSALGLSLIAILLAFVLGTKDPLVLTLTPSASVLDRVEMPKAEDEVRYAVKAYIEKRYKWEPANVTQRLREAETFVFPNAMKAYRSAVMNIVRFSTEKQVAQRVYPEKIDVNLERRTASISGDRITSIQGIKAAGDLRLELTFESGPRTKANPWGVYISKEKEE